MCPDNQDHFQEPTVQSGYTTGNKRKKEKHWKVDRVTASQDWRRFHGKESSPLEEIRELG